MARRKLSREEIFALVWEKPTREIGKELGVSDVAVAKLCKCLQVPKPPRGYWARVQASKTPRQPALGAFREEIDRKRREAIRVWAVANLSPIHGGISQLLAWIEDEHHAFKGRVQALEKPPTPPAD